VAGPGIVATTVQAKPSRSNTDSVQCFEPKRSIYLPVKGGSDVPAMEIVPHAVWSARSRTEHRVRKPR